MTTGWDMLPETAKALSAPLTKLVEVVAAGCGRVYGPTDIRRTARAEGDALVLLEEAKGRASEVAVRAAQRLLDVEARRQENLDAIVEEARLALPDEVSSEPVHPDWAARFFHEAGDISDEQMQTVWAKLLVGEVASPGTFSLRTLQLVKNLSANEANLFNALCSSSFRTKSRNEPFVEFDRDLKGQLEPLGLSFDSLQTLDAAGLIRVSPVAFAESKVTAFFVFAPQCMLHAASKTPRDLPTGNVYFTPSGHELATLCEWRIPDHRIDELEASLQRRGFAVTRHRGQVASKFDIERR